MARDCETDHDAHDRPTNPSGLLSPQAKRKGAVLLYLYLYLYGCVRARACAPVRVRVPVPVSVLRVFAHNMCKCTQVLVLAPVSVRAFLYHVFVPVQ